MYVVAGVSGRTGSVVAKGLLDAGKKVRVIVHEAAKGEPWKQRGAEVTVGELSDGAFVAKALAGAEAAYLLSPPPKDPVGFRANQRHIVDGLVAGVKDSKLPYLVFLSSIGAEREKGTGPIEALHYAETRLRDLPTKVVALRPGSFMENHAGDVGPAKGQGAFYAFGTADAPYEQIATKDIGAFALDALLHPPTSSEVRQLAGPKAYSGQDAARAFGEALDKKLNVVVVPIENAAGVLQGAGLPKEIAEAFTEMFGAMGRGEILFDGKAPIHRGKTPLADVIRELAR